MSDLDRKFKLLRFKWNTHVWVFVWAQPNLWMWFGAVFLVRDIHWMIHGTYEHLALASALIWSVLVGLQRNKLYAPLAEADTQVGAPQEEE